METQKLEITGIVQALEIALTTITNREFNAGRSFGVNHQSAWNMRANILAAAKAAPGADKAALIAHLSLKMAEYRALIAALEAGPRLGDGDLTTAEAREKVKIVELMRLQRSTLGGEATDEDISRAALDELAARRDYRG